MVVKSLSGGGSQFISVLVGLGENVLFLLFLSVLDLLLVFLAPFVNLFLQMMQSWGEWVLVPSIIHPLILGFLWGGEGVVMCGDV